MKNAVSSAERGKRLLMWVCVAALVMSALPLYAVSFYNHPYYDDYGFSADTHRAWVETGSLSQVLKTAVSSSQSVRQTWQGTYTGTFLSNIQPGVFSESLYFIGTFILLSAFILCFGYFFHAAFGGMFGLDRRETVILSCLSLTLLLQFMPDPGEAFYWFNGGIGNTFVYSLLALSFGLSLGLARARSGAKAALLTAALALCMVLLGGGSYGGGLFGLCAYALITLWLFLKKHMRKWHFLALWTLFLICFFYSMSAPGNAVRAGIIGYQPSAVRAVAQALYQGVAQIGGCLRLPLLAVSALAAPFLYRAARRSAFRFKHPWLLLGLMVCLYCTQFVPPLYSIASIGDGRIVNTYFQSFVLMWFIYLYYLLGYISRRTQEPGEPFQRAKRGLLLACACALLVGCLGYKRPEDKLYGVQNMAGVSAALSIMTGEAAQYDREMKARETLLNDASLPDITLSPLSAVPPVFMGDLLTPGAAEDVRPALCGYYGKRSIAIAGKEEAP